MLIRRENKRDLPFLNGWVPWSVWESLSEMERVTSDPNTIAQYARGRLNQLRRDPIHALILIAEIQRQQVGYLLATASPDGTTGEMQGLLIDLFVIPQLRRRGIGRALQREGVEQFARSGVRKVKMWADLHQQGALHLFASAGFQPEGLIGVKPLSS